ncbi:uracil-DNA glycosylase family protein [Govanella unica]|uniref:Uracil-DNA glycosylase family protein n=1 Tax=Govanella unica TaxID=2975056 RepID=A0A9X3TXI1_9PROT|nr:uracil-DNA glycosylase family protein [Govania unica]MDA5193571.1 uracil-DNA glycosylase family protein [Govania unica]
MSAARFDRLLADIRACRICVDYLPLGPNPVIQASRTARLIICGQAPGLRVHQTGIPFNDPSGDRLRDWMGLDRATFYDAARISIIPMGFCYPGRDPRGGDMPPRPECAAHWHDRIFAQLPNPRLVLAIGQYAQAYHLAGRTKGSVAATVRAWAEYGPDIIPLPHPSPRNMGWLRRNPWFEAEVVPVLRARVAAYLRDWPSQM